MLRLSYALRLSAVTVCAAIALVAVFGSLASYSRLGEGRGQMQANLAHFRAAGGFVMQFRAAHQRYPTKDELNRWTRGKGFEKWASTLSGDSVGGASVACTEAQPEHDFAPPSSDTYILSRWRGEWFDCYSLPSRTNNIIHPLPGENASSHVLLWTLAPLMLLVGWLIAPFRRRRLSRA